MESRQTIPTALVVIVLLPIIVVAIVMTYVITFLSVLIHEVGHAVAAKARKIPIYRVCILQLTLFKREPYLHISLPFHSYVLAIRDGLTRKDLAIFYAGGPFFTLLASVASG